MSENRSQQVTKKNNKLAILNLIHKSISISQASIARELGLRPSTVSNLSRELLEQGFIEIVGKGVSGKNGGKRSDLLSIAPDFACFSGIYIHQESIASHLIDYEGNLHHTSDRDFEPSSPDTVIDIVAEEIRGHREKCPNYRGAGIAVSSIVNSTGDVSISPDFPWEIPDFTGKLRSLTGGYFPVLVENDANCAALYMYHTFKGRYPNLLLFLYSHTHCSLGGGVIIGGRLYKGSHGEAGEIIRQEKKDIVESFSSYIARIGTFLSPDLIVLAADGESGRTLTEVHRKVKEEMYTPESIITNETQLPILGAAYSINRTATEKLV